MVKKSKDPVRKFYTFMQNNSGGSFVHDPVQGLGYAVAIEARSADEANTIAERVVGIYFEGVDEGLDCSCCGDRWSRADESDGFTTPCRYGDGDPLVGGWGYPAYVHHLDGTVYAITKVEKP